MIAAPLRIVIFEMISVVLQTPHVLNGDQSTNIYFSKMPLKSRIKKFQFYISWSIYLSFYPRALSDCCLFYICVLFSRPYLVLLYWEDHFVMLFYVFIYSLIIQFLSYWNQLSRSIFFYFCAFSWLFSLDLSNLTLQMMSSCTDLIDIKQGRLNNTQI